MQRGIFFGCPSGHTMHARREGLFVDVSPAHREQNDHRRDDDQYENLTRT
jgi:hypothetical protein